MVDMIVRFNWFHAHHFDILKCFTFLTIVSNEVGPICSLPNAAACMQESTLLCQAAQQISVLVSLTRSGQMGGEPVERTAEVGPLQNFCGEQWTTIHSHDCNRCSSRRPHV